MKNALMGLITGFAQGTSDRITEERLEEKTLLANRFKLAAANKKQRDIEDKEKKETASQRNSQINTFFAGASLEQRLALMSNETMFNLAIENKDTLAGPANQSKLNEFIVLKADEIPKDYKVAQDYVTSLKSVPQGEAKMPEMQAREVFFSRVTPDQREMDGMAAAFGTSSAAELLAYENMPDATASPVFGSVNLDVLKKKPGIDDRLKAAGTVYTDAVLEFGDKSPEAAAAKQATTILQNIKNTLDPEKANWASYVGGLKMAMIKGETQEERASATKEYDRVIALEKRGKSADSGIPTLPQLSSLLRSTMKESVKTKFGKDVGDDLVFVESDTGGSYQYIGTDANMKQKVADHAVATAKSLISVYMSPTGVPLNTDVRTALMSAGVPFDEATSRFDFSPRALPDTDTGTAKGAPKKPVVVLPGRTGRGTPPAAAPAAPAAPAPKTATMAQVEQIAQNNNVSIAAVKADMVSKGFIIK